MARILEECPDCGELVPEFEDCSACADWEDDIEELDN